LQAGFCTAWRKRLLQGWCLPKLTPDLNHSKMRHRNIFLIIVLLLSAIGFSMKNHVNNKSETKRWLVSQNSSLSVNGSTNINAFSCVIPAYDQVDTLTVSENNKAGVVILSGMIGLSISSFDCHNSGMTKQLQKTLKEKQFPVLFIRFLSLHKLPELSTKPEFITGLVNINLAGVNKRFEINYQISQDAQKVIHLLGSRDLNFSDFNLIPPTKLGGMIKTKDKLTVTFHLKMKTI
jgi:hypothetical protein